MKVPLVLSIVAAAAVLGASVSTASADNRGMSIGIGNAPRAGRPGAQSNYSQPAYTGGNYYVRNQTNQSPYVYGGFVSPSIVVQPPLIAPNYYLPGDFYARSNYYVPTTVQPVLIYQPQQFRSQSSFGSPPPFAQRGRLSVSPFNR